MSQTHSPALPATATKTLHERQRHYDKLHHEKRLQDLDGEGPGPGGRGFEQRIMPGFVPDGDAIPEGDDVPSATPSGVS